MNYSPQIKYLKKLITEFANAIPAKQLNQLYIEHQKITKIRNKRFLQEFKYVTSKTSTYLKLAAPTIQIFKTDYLNSVIILNLLNSTHKHLFSELKHNEIAYLIGGSWTPQHSIETERTVQRMLKRPNNRNVITNLRETYREITFKSYTESTSF